MQRLRIALRNIKGNPVKSLTIFFTVFGVAAYFVSLTLIMGGAKNSLDSGIGRLGADIIVVPQGAENKVESALLMGKPTNVWMPDDNVKKISAVSGVQSVSPQIFLASMYGSSCCAVNEMFMVAYDPETDFTITPWLQENLGRALKLGESIGGTYIFVPDGEPDIKLYGYHVALSGNLEPTGTGIDQTLFMSFDTAFDMARSSATTAEMVLDIPRNYISSIMVKVDQGADPHRVALDIEKTVPGVLSIESPNLFGSFRKQMLGLLSSFVVLTGLAWAVSGIIIGLIFSMATHERRREIAVLRAMGFTRFYVFQSLWLEAVILAAAAALAGIIISAAGIYYFNSYIAGTLSMPFLFPSPGSLLNMALLALLLSLVMVSLAVLWPAFRISQQQPAIAMRE